MAIVLTRNGNMSNPAHRGAFCLVVVIFSLALQANETRERDVQRAGCDAEAESIFNSARQSDQENRLEEARALYFEAAERCDRADYWMAVGNIWLNDFLDDDVESVNERGGPALSAYAHAYEAARRDRNKLDGARAARAMVELGLRAGDPNRANDWLIHARALDPTAPTLDDLQKEVNFARIELSTEEIETAISPTRGLGRVSSILMTGMQGGPDPFWDADVSSSTASDDGESPGRPPVDIDAPPPKSVGRWVNFPVNFEFNSTRMTAQTSQNIENLATVLAQEPGGLIVFVGHADVRGDANYNKLLSLQRALAVQREVEALQPNLASRIAVEGRGEESPIDPGSTESAHANNRRLEVVIKD
jgi:outer membrane protein OmpA-like peptidoglycan-associated protein